MKNSSKKSKNEQFKLNKNYKTRGKMFSKPPRLFHKNG